MRLILTFILTALLSACLAERAPLVATDIVVPKPRPGAQMTVGYLTLRNNTTQAITIAQVRSPEFESVEMHESVLEDGVARMNPLHKLTLSAGQSVKFEPGGKHLMLMRPVGEIGTATLEFYNSEAVMLTVNVTLTD